MGSRCHNPFWDRGGVRAHLLSTRTSRAAPFPSAAQRTSGFLEELARKLVWNPACRIPGRSTVVSSAARPLAAAKETKSSHGRR